VAANRVFRKTVFDVDIYGEKFQVKKPTGILKQEYINGIDELNEKKANGAELKGDEDYKLTAKFLSKLGLPEKVFRDMEDEHQLELVLMVLTEKKS